MDHLFRSNRVDFSYRIPSPQPMIHQHHSQDHRREYAEEYIQNRDLERRHDRIAERHVTHERAVEMVRQWKIEQARERMVFEITRYDREVKDYLRLYTDNEDTMKRTAETLYEMDEDQDVLATKTADFLQGLRKVPDSDDSDDADTLVESEEGTEDGQLPPQMKALPKAKSAAPTHPAPNKFMHWSSFEPHPLNRNTDIVDDRRKSYVALANEIGVGVGVPFGEVTLEGFLGLIVRVLRPQDWRAYFKASEARNIWLPQSIAERPSALELEQMEDNLFGTSQYTGIASSMTCLTYSKFDYGTITLFKVNRTNDYEGGTWPQSIEPVAAMTYVPKKLLKRMVRSVPKTNRTKLEVRSKATNESDRFKWSSDPDGAYSAYSPNVKRSKLPEAIAEALALEMSWLKDGDYTVNIVCATIPKMVAWLHIKASLLTEIEVEGTEFRKGSDIKGVVRWKKGPSERSHNGKDPCIVVLHPRDVDWVSMSLYWTGVKDM